MCRPRTLQSLTVDQEVRRRASRGLSLAFACTIFQCFRRMPVTNRRIVRAPRGTQLNTKGWQTEGPLRMLMNNLDPDVAERPDDLVVYGGRGKAARDWDSFDR